MEKVNLIKICISTYANVTMYPMYNYMLLKYFRKKKKNDNNIDDSLCLRV
jgi:hypothetical protein